MAVAPFNSMAPHQNSNRDAVQQFFNENATDYSCLFLPKRSGSNFGFLSRLSLALQMTANISGRLLDCACGSGEITAAILDSKRFTEATVVDLSPKMLALARQRIEDKLKLSGAFSQEFIQSDIFAFDVQSRAGQYDLVLGLGLIAHAGRIDELLPKLKMLLSPRGKILLQSSLLDHAGNRLVRWLTEERYRRRHGYRISYFRHKDIEQAAEKAGLTIGDVRRFTFGFPFGDRLSARLNYHLEKAMNQWSRAHGAEALYLLEIRP
jgi:ubiquinone/menaquinone biosynthesis C-methylase UbiE